MLKGTISQVDDHGSVMAVWIKQETGDECAVYGDTRVMSHFLDDVIAFAGSERLHPGQVEVAASGPGLANWMALGHEVPEHEEDEALVGA